MSEEPLFLSSAITGILACLEGDEPAGNRSYPPVADKSTVRMPEEESVHHWLSRCASDFREKGWPIEKWEAAPDLAIIALVEWREPGRELQACSIQVLKTEGTLGEFVADPSVVSHYFRFDWDYGTIGPMFTHPLPHVHAWKADNAPRFVSEGEGGNVVVDFLEWICRHYYHEEWLLWAADVCDREFDKKFGKDKNPLDYIFRAFRESKFSVLRGYTEEIKFIKHLLSNEKDGAYALRVSSSDRELLKHP